ncbi:MAG: hypothetical protein U0167_00565 [bacterium]
MSKLGLVKRTQWQFEREWRYRVTEAIDGTFQKGKVAPDDVEFRHLYWYGMETDAVYPRIRAEALTDMAITLGPLVGEGDALLAMTLTSKFAPWVPITPSTVRIRPRAA